MDFGNENKFDNPFKGSLSLIPNPKTNQKELQELLKHQLKFLTGNLISNLKCNMKCKGQTRTGKRNKNEKYSCISLGIEATSIIVP